MRYSACSLRYSVTLRCALRFSGCTAMMFHINSACSLRYSVTLRCALRFSGCTAMMFHINSACSLRYSVTLRCALRYSTCRSALLTHPAKMRGQTNVVRFLLKQKSRLISQSANPSSYAFFVKCPLWIAFISFRLSDIFTKKWLRQLDCPALLDLQVCVTRAPR